MRHRSIPLPALLLAVLAGLSAGFGEARAQPDPQEAGIIEFETYELDNGLTVILAPDPLGTAVAVNLWYDVGSRHERPGRSGFGHLFEHLMFQGSENVQRGEHMQRVQRAGGSLNASITEDRTNYFQTMPPNRYNLALWLESDRMLSLDITEENMQREVEVVKEERRLRVDDQPYGTSNLQAFYYAAYDSANCFPYAHSVIGSIEDLDAAELEDVQDFFDSYYAPNNATLTVAGAFDPEEARGLIEDRNANLPAVFISWGGVSAGHPDSYALSMLSSILGQGETSRLYRRLVRDEQAALQAQFMGIFRRGPGILLTLAIANQGIDIEEVERLIDEEVARIRDEGVTAEELERAQNRERASTLRERQTAMGRAEALQWHNHFLGDPGLIGSEMERYMAVTPEDVRRVAREYLNDDNRAVIITRPGATMPGGGS